jgi:hypothetical protein
MKQPIESDFAASDRGAVVEVHFKPTSSVFLFARLRKFDDVVKFGRLSPDAVRHAGPTGDFADYTAATDDIFTMARQLALKAMRDRFHGLLGPGPRSTIRQRGP